MDDVQYYYSTDEICLGITNPDMEYGLNGDGYYSLPDTDPIKPLSRSQGTDTYQVLEQESDSQCIGL